MGVATTLVRAGRKAEEEPMPRQSRKQSKPPTNSARARNQATLTDRKTFAVDARHRHENCQRADRIVAFRALALKLFEALARFLSFSTNNGATFAAGAAQRQRMWLGKPGTEINSRRTAARARRWILM